MSLDECIAKHDWFTALLTFGLCCGLVISYVPQHYRIISTGTSVGLSPWFLLLGSTSAAAGMLNMVTLQWHIVRCCRVLPLGSCVEMSAGIIQVGLQWLMFTMILVLYMIYYPHALRYGGSAYDYATLAPPSSKVAVRKGDEWRTSIILAWTVAVHFTIICIITIYLLSTRPVSPSPADPLPPLVSSWATLLGVSSAILAAIQYAPQLVYTYQTKLVGALSIPMMLIQTPGAVLMVLSIALRPGTNWTSWITFAVAGIMQGSLLTMCLVWKVRQRRLGVDDFGRAIGVSAPASETEDSAHVASQGTASEVTSLLRPGNT
ncbi:hypothetical protein AX17_006365 [Amanita inopinata Kibby_2008]|nr:hypothetical protein AX17_006365 [Amanita inopinata Kibby_2008]